MPLSDISRVSLGVFPTPIQKLENISRELCTNVYIKRDDLTGIGLGGNKVRKLEYLLEDARQKGAEIVLTTVPFSSDAICFSPLEGPIRTAAFCWLPVLTVRFTPPFTCSISSSFSSRILLFSILSVSFRFRHLFHPCSVSIYASADAPGSWDDGN